MEKKPDAMAFHLKWQHAAYSKDVNTLSCQTEIQASQRQTRKFRKEILFLSITFIFYLPSRTDCNEIWIGGVFPSQAYYKHLKYSAEV